MKNELEQKNNLVAIGALAIFYFVFLGGEYLFDNMIAHYLSSAKVVVAQSGILGISGIGFLCYFQIQRFISSKNRGGALMGAVDRLHFYGAAARIVCRNAVDRTDFIFAAGNFGRSCPPYGSGALGGKPQAGAMRRDSLRSRDPDAVHQ